MNQKTKYILAGIVFFLAINIVVVPFISRGKAKATVNRMMNFWIQNDTAMAMKYFIHANDSPPFYDLKSYKIHKVKFLKVDGKLRAQFHMTLEFPPDNIVPSGKTWICELTRVDRQWKVLKFVLSNE